MTQTPGGVPARDPRGHMPLTYRMPARSLGIGAIVRRRTPAGAIIDHVIDRIELRPGDEVRIDIVDPATGWGAFLVLDGSVEVEVVGVDEPPGDVEVVDDAPSAGVDRNGTACFANLPSGRRCVRALGHPGLHHDAVGNEYADDDVVEPRTAYLMPDVDTDDPRCTDVEDGVDGCPLPYDHLGDHGVPS